MRLKIILSDKKTTTTDSLPVKIEKPWGHELIWAHTKDYVAKILFVKRGESLSLQYHNIKEETLFIETGECVIETGPDEKHLAPIPHKPGSIFHVPPGRLHRIVAVSDCRIFEVSTPHLSDVVRLEDRYGRKGT